MKKKIVLGLICMLFIISCGKKGDPEYKAEKNNNLTFKI